MAMACDVDILTSGKYGTLTIGITSDIARRAWNVRLIERDNSDWDDPYNRLNGEADGSRQQVPGRQQGM